MMHSATALDQAKPSALVFLGPPHETLRGARCTFDLWVPAPDIMVTHVNGYAEWPDVRWYTQRADRIISTGQSLYIFHDFEGLTGYDAATRTKLTEWAAKRNKFLPGTHFLIRTRILAMGVSVAALALGRPLKAFSSRREFEATLQKKLADRPALSMRPHDLAGPASASMRDLPSPMSTREGAGPSSLREGASPVSLREGASPVSLRSGLGPFSVR
jgi:hypothetical protein